MKYVPEETIRLLLSSRLKAHFEVVHAKHFPCGLMTHTHTHTLGDTFCLQLCVCVCVPVTGAAINFQPVQVL